MSPQIDLSQIQEIRFHSDFATASICLPNDKRIKVTVAEAEAIAIEWAKYRKTVIAKELQERNIQ